jgi:hypothetical protein
MQLYYTAVITCEHLSDDGRYCSESAKFQLPMESINEEDFIKRAKAEFALAGWNTLNPRITCPYHSG